MNHSTTSHHIYFFALANGFVKVGLARLGGPGGHRDLFSALVEDLERVGEAEGILLGTRDCDCSRSSDGGDGCKLLDLLRERWAIWEAARPSPSYGVGWFKPPHRHIERFLATGEVISTMEVAGPGAKRRAS